MHLLWTDVDQNISCYQLKLRIIIIIIIIIIIMIIIIIIIIVVVKWLILASVSC